MITLGLFAEEFQKSDIRGKGALLDVASPSQSSMSNSHACGEHDAKAAIAGAEDASVSDEPSDLCRYTIPLARFCAFKFLPSYCIL